MSFKEGVKRKWRLCFVGKENRKESDKNICTYQYEKNKLLGENREEPRTRGIARREIDFCS